MRKTIKLLALAVTMVMVLGLLAGCGGAKSPVAETTTQAASSVAATPAVVKLSIAANSMVQVPNDAKYLKAMGDKYGIEFDMWPCFGDSFADQVNTRLASGDMPDVISGVFSLNTQKLIEQNIIVPITEDFIKQEMSGWYNELYANADNPFKLCKVNGQIYGFPGQNCEGIYHFTNVWRSDWLANVGITKTPETLAEYQDALYKFTNNDPDKNGKKDTYGLSNKGLIPVFGAFGPVPFDIAVPAPNLRYMLKDGKVAATAVQPEMKEALALLAKWYKDGVIDPEFLTGERTEGAWAVSQAFAKGKIGFSAPGMFYNTIRKSDPPQTDGDFYTMFRTTQDALGNKAADYVLGAPPVGPKGASGGIKWGVDGGIAVSFTSALAKDEAKMKKAANFFGDLWSNFDNYVSAWNGTKDVDWKYDDETQGVTYGWTPEIKAATEKNQVETIGLGGFLLVDVPQMSHKINPKFYAQYADKIANFSDGYYDVLYNATIAAKDKYGKELAALTVSAYYDIITGKKPLDSFDQFVKDFDSNGGSEIMQEANTWYAALAKK